MLCIFGVLICISIDWYICKEEISKVHSQIQEIILLFQTPQETTWVVTSVDKLRYDAMFKQADKDADGLVSGITI